MQPSANPEPPAPMFNHWGLCSALLLAPALRSRQRTAPCELGSHPVGPPATSDPASPCAGLSKPSCAADTICSQGIKCHLTWLPQRLSGDWETCLPGRRYRGWGGSRSTGDACVLCCQGHLLLRRRGSAAPQTQAPRPWRDVEPPRGHRPPIRGAPTVSAVIAAPHTLLYLVCAACDRWRDRDIENLNNFPKPSSWLVAETRYESGQSDLKHNHIYQGRGVYLTRD